MAALVMCNFTTSPVGALRASAHQSGSSPFPVKITVKSTMPRGCSSSASQTVESCSGSISQENDSTDTVFSDESKGIVCYRNESGEITCEGPDEGPCFYPHSAQLSQQLMFSSIYLSEIQVARPFSFCTEDAKDICIKECMGALFCEGRDES